MRLTSFVLSLILHVLVIAGGLLFISGPSTKIRLDRPIFVDLASGPFGGYPGPANEGAPGEAAPGANPEIKDSVEAAAPPPEQPDVPQPEIKESKPEPKPVPPVKTEDKKISDKKTDKTKTEEEPKEKKKKEPDPNEVLAKALESAKKDASKTKADQTLDKALASLRKEGGKSGTPSGGSGGTGGAGGGGGKGKGGAAGLVQVYAQIIESKVKEKWRYPKVGNKDNFNVEIEIRLNDDGTVADAKVLKSSGKPAFDSSALKAIMEAEDLPPPPVNELKKLVLNFNLQELK